MTVDGKSIAAGGFRINPPAGESGSFRFEMRGVDEAIKQLQAQLDAMKGSDNAEARAAIEAALASLKAQGEGGFKMWKAVPAPADPFTPKARFGVAVDAVPEAVPRLSRGLSPPARAAAYAVSQSRRVR